MIRVTEEVGGFPVSGSARDVLVGSGFELTGYSAFNFDIDIAANSITLVSNALIPPGAGFFGFGFADYQLTVPRISSVMVTDQNGFGSFGASNFGITEGGDKIFVDFSGVSISTEDRLVLGVEFEEPSTGVIPLPATLPLMLGGFAGLAVFRRRRGA